LRELKSVLKSSYTLEYPIYSRLFMFMV